MTAFMQGGKSQPLEASCKLQSRQPSRPGNAKQFQAVHPLDCELTGTESHSFTSDGLQRDISMMNMYRSEFAESNGYPLQFNHENMMLLVGRNIQQGPV